MTGMKTYNYIETVKRRIEKKRVFHDPITGEEYKIKKWKRVKSTLPDYQALIVSEGYIRVTEGVTYAIKKKSILDFEFKMKFIISIMYIEGINSTKELKEKFIDKTKIEDGVSYIFCFPSENGWKGPVPKNSRISFVLVDLKNNNIYGIDPRIRNEYAYIFMPREMKQKKILSNTEEKVRDYIEKHGKLYYSADEVSEALGISILDVKRAFVHLEKEHFFGGTVEHVDGRTFFNLFSYTEEKDEEDVSFFEKIIKRNKKIDNADIDEYKNNVNALYVKYNNKIKDMDRFIDFLDESYKKAKKQKDSRDAVEILRTREMAVKERDRLERLINRVNRLKEAFMSMKGEEVPEQVMEKISIKDSYITEDERKMRREKEFLEILWDMGLDDEEEEKLRKEYMREEWWENGDSVDITCPKCGESSVYLIEIDISESKKDKIYYCDNCGHVWR